MKNNSFSEDSLETAAGAGMTLASYGFASPVGVCVTAHGLDRFFTGMQTAFTGHSHNTVTSQLFQKAGIPPDIANTADNTLSLIVTLGATNAIRSASRHAFPPYRLPEQTVTTNQTWVLPEKGGGSVINGRWYTEHALERMAPRTPEVMAKLEARCLDRAQAKGILPQTDKFHDWMLVNGPNPRGIPPAVIEAEIANSGSTGVKVFLNNRGNIITIIPGGK